MNQVQRQDDIIKLQDFLLQQENVNLAVSHYFSDGLYARELTIPAGVILVGAKHKTRHLYTVVQGKCKVSSKYEDLNIEAPFMGENIPDTKREMRGGGGGGVCCLSPTHLTDVKKIEQAILEPEEI